MQNIKLLTVTQRSLDTISFYRVHGVFNNLKNHLDFNLIIDSKEAFSWVDILNSDIIFMQKPYNNTHLQMVNYVKEMGKVLWVDYDDNLFEISPANFKAYESFHSDEIKQNIAKIIASSDVVSVTTKELKRSFEKLNKNIHIIPNAIDMDSLSYRDADLKKREKRILWRGYQSHFLDLAEYSHEISNMVDKFKSHQFVFMGIMPWYLDPSKNNVTYLPPVDPFIYFRSLISFSPAAVQVPLMNTHFNKCKSNIGYIEGIFSGGVVICPDWEDWDLPGALNYSNHSEYENHIKNVCKGEIDIERLNKLGWEYIWDNLNLNKINIKRAELIKNHINN